MVGWNGATLVARRNRSRVRFIWKICAPGRASCCPMADWALNRAGCEARAVLLTGEGNGFSSGANLVDSQVDIDDPMRDAGLSLDAYLHPMVLAVRALDLPVVVAVQGVAVRIRQQHRAQ